MGKTALVAALCARLRDELSLVVVTNDIYTTEDADFLRKHAVLPDDRIRAVRTGCCPHTAIRDDITANLDAVEELADRHDPDLVLVESGGDNLTATFSYGLVDTQVFVLDVAGGDKVPRKGGPGVTRSDLLVINKIDLAPLVDADLAVMRATPNGSETPDRHRSSRCASSRMAGRWWSGFATGCALTLPGEGTGGADRRRCDALALRPTRGAAAVLREHVVLGRAGQRGGRYRGELAVEYAAVPLLRPAVPNRRGLVEIQVGSRLYSAHVWAHPVTQRRQGPPVRARPAGQRAARTDHRDA